MMNRVLISQIGFDVDEHSSDTHQSSIYDRHAIDIRGHGEQPMLFAHGFGCSQMMWHDIVPAFEKDYKAVLFDHVGAGRSDLSAYDAVKYASLGGYAADVVEICDALGLRDVVFVGHSVSAMVGVLAAIERPDLFSRLVLIGPSPCYLDLDDYRGGFSAEDVEEMLELLNSNFLGWSNAMGPAIMGNPERPELGASLVESFCATDPAIAAHFARVTFFSDNRADLSRMSLPALVMQCSEDVIAPDHVGRYVAENLPRGSFIQLAATGHCPHVSHPDEVVTSMRRYLSRTGKDNRVREHITGSR